MCRQPLNARSKRTRLAILRAFAALMRGNRYESLKVADITTRTRISRSTFYSHYRNMDALLTDSIRGPFAVLADSFHPAFAESKLVALLEHFWEGRGLARGVLVGPVRDKTSGVLVRLIEDRLRSTGFHRRGSLIWPPKLVATQLAEILLAPITAWLLGESRCSPEALAKGLRRVSVAAISAMSP
jgi:AcrR family transcriptional regulator